MTAADTLGMYDMKAGDVILFGRYPQRGLNAEPEPIEWIVLKNKDGKALLISKYGLAARSFEDERTGLTNWEECTLRKWLNGGFLEAAFTEEERARLETATVEAEFNQDEDTRDTVFILNDEEVEKYFSSDEARMCRPTVRAIEEGAYVKAEPGTGSGNCWWWLRTPSVLMSNYVCIVDVDGRIDEEGFYINISGSGTDLAAVRPAVVLRVSPSAPAGGKAFSPGADS